MEYGIQAKRGFEENVRKQEGVENTTRKIENVTIRNEIVQIKKLLLVLNLKGQSSGKISKSGQEKRHQNIDIKNDKKLNI